MKGRVVVVKAYGKPFEIEEYDVTEPVPGATLLRMTQAGICGSDLHTWRGASRSAPTGRTMNGRPFDKPRVSGRITQHSGVAVPLGKV